MSIDYKYDVRPGRRSQAKVLIFETDMDEGKIINILYLINILN